MHIYYSSYRRQPAPGLFSPEMALWRQAVAFNLIIAVVLLSYVHFFPVKVVIVPHGTTVPAVATSTPKQERPYKAVKAFITGYTLTEAETDQTPTISASGHDILGRSDVVACPRHLPFGTEVEIDGKNYVCLDRMAKKFNGRFDINCNLSKECAYAVTGWHEVKIYEN